MHYLKIFTDFEDAIAPLGDPERGRLFTAMLHYARTGEELKLIGNERFIWPSAKANIDREVQFIDKQRSNGQKGGRPTKTQINPTKPNESQKSQKDNDNDKEKKIKNFDSVAPTPTDVNEVIEYSRSFVLQNIPESECEKFFDHFSSNGWKVSGKTPMKDWKAAFRNWIRNVDTFGPAKKKQNYDQHQATDEDLNHLLMDLDA